MKLVLSVVALLGAAGLLSGLSAEQRPSRDRYAIGAVSVAVAVAMALVGGHLWSRIQALDDRAEATSKIGAPAAGVAGGAALGQNLAFLDWCRARIPAGDTFYVFPAGPLTDPATYQWSTYQLAPRLSVAKPDDADWLIFYNAEPRKSKYDLARFEPPVRYADGFYLARRHAS